MKKNQGITLIEILVSCVILALLVGGLGSIFVAGSRWIMDIQAQTTADEISKLFLDPMQMHVRQSPTAIGNDQWDGGNNALRAGNSYCGNTTISPSFLSPLCCPGGPIDPAFVPDRRNVGKIDYNVDYNIGNFVDSTTGIDYNVRKVRATINWKEPETH